MKSVGYRYSSLRCVFFKTFCRLDELNVPATSCALASKTAEVAERTDDVDADGKTLILQKAQLNEGREKPGELLD